MTGSGGRSSIPEASVIESIGRGVLDTRLRGYDSHMWGRIISVIASAAKQSISPRKGRMDCFAALAMTWISRSVPERTQSVGPSQLCQR
jgi:hypothetical protein